MNVAFYGRYSSDNQKETSIEDQRRVVARWAERHAHVIVAEFADAAVSGANAKVRSGLQRALRAALSPDRRFDAIAIDQLSRLSRDVGDTDAMVKQLRFSGVRVIAVADGIDTADESTKISVTVKSLVNELYLDDLRKTTKRGLDGQFLKGFSTGGRTYGYRSQPVYDPSGRVDPCGNPVPLAYRLTVHPREAAVVREIFRLFAEGHGEKTIAKQLNGGCTGRVWRPNTIYFMLQNSRYVGRFYFNRREWRKNPESGRRVYRWRPEGQWESLSIEDLRIVDDATWEAAQHRLKNRKHMFSTRPSTIHLLSGFLVCDRCRGALTIVSKDYYGCRNRAESGTCQNSLLALRESVEWLVIGAVAHRLSPIADDLCKAATRDVSPQQPPSTAPARAGDLRRQAEAVMQAIRDGRLSGRALDEALRTYQSLWDRIESLDRQGTPDTTQSTPSAIHYDRGVIEDFLAHLPEAIRVDISLGRELLRDLVSEVRISDEGPRPTICPLCGKVLAKLTPQHMACHELSLQEAYRRFPQLGFNRKARLVIQPGPHSLFDTLEVYGEVAGDGFEPSTFGL
jgi:site-specific DNA recombinase